MLSASPLSTVVKPKALKQYSKFLILHRKQNYRIALLKKYVRNHSKTQYNFQVKPGLSLALRKTLKLYTSEVLEDEFIPV